MLLQKFLSVADQFFQRRGMILQLRHMQGISETEKMQMGIIEPGRDKSALKIHAEIVFCLFLSHISKSAVFNYKAIYESLSRIDISVLISYSHPFLLFLIIPCTALFFLLRTTFCSKSPI